VPSFWMKQGDTGPVLRKQMLDADGDPVDLTGATDVEFHMRLEGATTAAVNAAADPDPDQGTNTGYIEYQWIEADTATPGTYEAEFQATLADGTIVTWPNRGHMIGVIEGQIA
jgi:hypothetical protein